VPFELKLSIRYLLSTKLQSGLLVLGVAVGVVVFTFIAALINGLGVRLTDDVVGNIAHITLEAPERKPAAFMAAPSGRALMAIQPGSDTRAEIRSYRQALLIASKQEGVIAAVPEVVGNATLVRGEKDVAVAVTGVLPRDASSIARLDRSLVRGRVDLGPGDLIVGSRLAEELGIDVGDRVVLRPGRALRAATGETSDLTVTLRGIFNLGSQAVDSRTAFMELGVAQKTFGVADGVTQVEIKLEDPWQAPALAKRLERSTQLKVTHWLERNARLQEGLRSQQSTGSLIKFFSLLTIMIGVASALLLAVLRRRSEIGILRSFGIRRGSIVTAFLLQGVLVGATGACIGAVVGYGFCRLLYALTMKPNGLPSIPVDPSQGQYLSAVLFAIVASALAAILPARSAANIDPLKAIQS